MHGVVKMLQSQHLVLLNSGATILRRPTSRGLSSTAWNRPKIVAGRLRGNSYEARKWPVLRLKATESDSNEGELQLSPRSKDTADSPQQATTAEPAASTPFTLLLEDAALPLSQGPSGVISVSSNEGQSLLSVLNLCATEQDLAVVGQTYDALKDRGLLRSFGAYQASTFDAQPRMVTPSVLKDLTGLEASRLAPQKWGLSNSVPALALFASFSLLIQFGIDLRPLAVALLALGIIDAVQLGGATASQLLMAVWSPYRERVLVHEAGHALVAYLLGCPVRGVVLDAFEAMSSGINGLAGTQFWDKSLDEGMRTGEVTGATVDRYSVVLFAGIAAEAMVFGKAEGGESDENLFKSFVADLQPPWPPAKLSNQARWALVQALRVLRRNRSAHTAVVEVLRKKGDMKAIATAIESNVSQP